MSKRMTLARRTALALALGAAATGMAFTANAAAVSYNTTGSTLSCNGVSGCVQNTSTSVTKGGITLTYNAGSGSGVVQPSVINFGNLVSTGTGTAVDFTGMLLTINVNSTPPGASGTLPNGTLSGTIGTSNSNLVVAFSPSNTTTAFGTLPGVTIAAAGVGTTYQVLNTSLPLMAPTIGNPIGQTSIQGAATSSAPPATPTLPEWALILSGFGLAGLGLAIMRRRRAS